MSQPRGGAPRPTPLSSASSGSLDIPDGDATDTVDGAALDAAALESARRHMRAHSMDVRSKPLPSQPPLPARPAPAGPADDPVSPALSLSVLPPPPGGRRLPHSEAPSPGDPLVAFPSLPPPPGGSGRGSRAGAEGTAGAHQRQLLLDLTGLEDVPAPRPPAAATTTASTAADSTLAALADLDLSWPGAAAATAPPAAASPTVAAGPPRPTSATPSGANYHVSTAGAAAGATPPPRGSAAAWFSSPTLGVGPGLHAYAASPQAVPAFRPSPLAGPPITAVPPPGYRGPSGGAPGGASSGWSAAITSPSGVPMQPRSASAADPFASLTSSFTGATK